MKKLFFIITILILAVVAYSFTTTYWIANEPNSVVTSTEAQAVAELADAIDGITSAEAGILWNAAQFGIAGYVVVSDGNYTVLAANSGKVHLLPNATATDTLTLPTPEAGLMFNFVYSGGAADAQNFMLDTGSNTNYYIGGVLFNDLDGDVMSNVFSDGNSNSKFTVVTPSAGTNITVISDGTHWYILGEVASNTVCTMADQ